MQVVLGVLRNYPEDWGAPQIAWSLYKALFPYDSSGSCRSSIHQPRPHLYPTFYLTICDSRKYTKVAATGNDISEVASASKFYDVLIYYRRCTWSTANWDNITYGMSAHVYSFVFRHILFTDKYMHK